MRMRRKEQRFGCAGDRFGNGARPVIPFPTRIRSCSHPDLRVRPDPHEFQSVRAALAVHEHQVRSKVAVAAVAPSPVEGGSRGSR